MKGVSELLSVVIIIGVIVVIAGLVGPWAMDLGRNSANRTQGSVDNQITCQSTAYDFDSSYGSNGVDWSLPSGWMKAKVLNTGTISLHSFSFQVYIQGTGYRFFQARGQGQDSLLRPGESVLLDAIINESLSGEVTEVKILNGVCRSISIVQEF
jgi:hypothetical protein